jgi:hypothetical protein
MTIYTEAGVVSLPTRIGGSVDFAFGRFMQGTVDCTSACSAVTTTATEGYNATRAEMMRSSIRLMLSGW